MQSYSKGHDKAVGIFLCRLSGVMRQRLSFNNEKVPFIKDKTNLAQRFTLVYCSWFDRTVEFIRWELLGTCCELSSEFRLQHRWYSHCWAINYWSNSETVVCQISNTTQFSPKISIPYDLSTLKKVIKFYLVYNNICGKTFNDEPWSLFSSEISLKYILMTNKCLTPHY